MAGIVAGIIYVKNHLDELRKQCVAGQLGLKRQSLTILVAVFSIIFSLAIWGVDTVFSKVIEALF